MLWAVFALVVSLLLIMCSVCTKRPLISASVAFIISASLEAFYQKCSEYFHELIGESVFVFYFSDSRFPISPCSPRSVCRASLWSSPASLSRSVNEVDLPETRSFNPSIQLEAYRYSGTVLGFFRFSYHPSTSTCSSSLWIPLLVTIDLDGSERRLTPAALLISPPTPSRLWSQFSFDLWETNRPQSNHASEK